MRVADLRKFSVVVVADITLLESALCKLKQWIVVKIVIGGGSLEVLGFKNHRQKLTETETETHPQASCD